ncbi:2-iminobutanoate/2-iminopropanoate deaminase [Prinia subflava]|uniref:2-iminobutanoate/2-iminopropanoate deaminase n=1 Tax=Prinia subflava TaxID=208062 RepID=UPI002FE20FB8
MRTTPTPARRTTFPRSPRGRRWAERALAGLYGTAGGEAPALTAASAAAVGMVSLVKKIISTTKAPALGPYSQAVLVDRTMYIAGQIGLEPSTGQLVSGGAKEEAKQALKNMGEILKAAGCDYSNVVKTTVLMADMKDYNDINDVYKQFFKANFPARAAYQVAALPRGARVEIEAIAIQGPLQEASAQL